MAVGPQAVALRVAEMAAKAQMTVQQFIEKYGSIQNWLIVSNAISEIWYQGLTETLWINFNKTKAYPKYRFDGVPGDVVAELVNASSPGSVYHSKIKGRYHSSSIRGPEEDGSQVRPQTGNLL